MKIKRKDSKRMQGRAIGMIGVFLVLLTGTFTARAQYGVSDFKWDCVLAGGGQKGLAFLTFSNDGEVGPQTVSGYELLASVPKGTSSNDRNSGGDVGRGDGTSTNSISSSTNVFVFGFTPVQGQWSFDENGKIVGFLSFVVSDTTSGDLTTNTISFRGKVHPGKKLNLVASTTFGTVTYRGVPYQAAPDFSNTSWIATKKQDKLRYNEFFTLAPSPYDPNIYSVYGSGPGYSYDTAGSGFCMISAQNRIGFSIVEFASDSTNGVMRATAGRLKSSKRAVKASTKGVIEPGTKISFTATAQ